MEDFFGKIADTITSIAINYGFKLLACIAILFIGFSLIKLLINYLKRAKFLNKMDLGVKSFLLSTLSVLLKIAVLVIIVSVLGIDTAPFVALFASVGVTVGLAFQGALSNFAGGILILASKPFKVGDLVEINGSFGIVHSINTLYTVIKTYDNRHITLPNGNVANSAVINFTAEKERRVDLTLKVKIDVEIEAVKEVILQEISKNTSVFTSPAPFVRKTEENLYNYIFAVKVWCKTEDYWNVMFELGESLRIALDSKGMSVK